jgi:hypothetical protein
MRPLLVLGLIAACAAVGACSKHDEAQTRHDARALAADVKADAHKLANDPDLRKAGAEVKKTASQAASAIKHTAQQTKDAAHKGAQDVRRKADDS